MAELFQNKTVSAFLTGIRKQFTDHHADKTGHPLHWGQFLDGLAQKQAQVGLYGGVAACIAYSADFRSQDQAAIDARTELAQYWQERTSTTFDDCEDNLRQNVRLTFLLAGLAFRHDFTDIVVQEVWELLKNRRLGVDGLWTDADFPENPKHPSEFSTAIILILLAIIRRTSTGNSAEFAVFDNVRVDAGLKLQKSYLDERKKSRPYKLIVLIAIMLSLEGKANKKVKSDLIEVSLDNVNVKSRYTHFFDYKKKNGNHARDYFILPIGILGAYLLFGKGLPSRQYLYATRVMETIESSLTKSTNHLFMEGERPSTLEQGLVVFALESWTMPKDWKEYTLWPARLWWWSNKEIDYTRMTALVFALPLYGPIVIATSAEYLMKFLTEQNFLVFLVPIILFCSLIPKWLLAAIGVVAGVIIKPQDLLKILVGKRK
ncbi:MAG: hypothetical protein A2503_17745 [Burkholderiales bacterium RIFOXYD12_FULL_59_19]|nr:MAG: hypothetical protein A2503_17745 [Burkholderiales bacterium RIFOXYD12_FULL_59_19]